MNSDRPGITGVRRPLNVQIADAIRGRISSGDLRPGDSIPSLGKLAKEWDCSSGTARAAHDLLRQEGLISNARGQAPVVRIQPPRVGRSNEKHQLGKNSARKPSLDQGMMKMDLGIEMSDEDAVLRFDYDEVEADEDLAGALHLSVGAKLLQRRWRWHHKHTGALLTASVSNIPDELIASKREVLTTIARPPGGTFRQLATFGIEVDRVEETVIARAMTTVERYDWDAEMGTPMLDIRRVLIDTDDRPVDVADITLPADRTSLHYTTPLKRWPRGWSL